MIAMANGNLKNGNTIIGLILAFTTEKIIKFVFIANRYSDKIVERTATISPASSLPVTCKCI
jgi:hypothetical protein